MNYQTLKIYATSPHWIKRIFNVPIGRRIARGAFWSLLGAGFGRGLNFLSGIFLARFLGKEGYGELAVIMSTVAMLQVFAIFGTANTSTKFVAEFRQTNPDKAGGIITLSSLFSLGVGLLIGALCYFSADWISNSILNKSELRLPIKISSAMMLLGALIAVQNGALAGFEAFRKIAILNVVTGIISFLFMLAGAHLKNILGAVVGMTVAMGIAAIINSIALTRERQKWSVPWNSANLKKDLSLIWQFNLPLMLAGILWAPVVWAGNAFLVNQDGGYNEMGIYNAGYSLFSLGLFVPNIIARLILPVISERIGCNDFEIVKKIINIGVKATFFLLTGYLIIVALLSKKLLLLYGEGFVDGWVSLVLIAFSVPFAGAQNMMTNSMMAFNKVWNHFYVNLIWSIVYVASAYVLVNLGFGAIGLATANLVSYILKFIMSSYILSKILKSI